MEEQSITHPESQVNGAGNGSMAFNGIGSLLNPEVQAEVGDIGSLQFGDGSDATGKEIVPVKRRRGRPRKYDGGAVTSSSPTLPLRGTSSPTASPNSVKRGRGRPKGTGKLQLLAALGGSIVETAGGNLTPHVINVLAGEDVVGRITSFARKGPLAICILSATGLVSSVVIRHPGSSGGMLRYEGRFEIIFLRGSFVFGEIGGSKNRSGMLSVSLAKSDGRVFGGGVSGSIIAAGPIQLVVASFKQSISKELKRKCSAESSTGASNFVDQTVSNGSIYIPRISIDNEGLLTTSTLATQTPVHSETDNVIAENLNFINSNPLHIVGPNTQLSQAPQSMKDGTMSPNTDANIPDMQKVNFGETCNG